MAPRSRSAWMAHPGQRRPSKGTLSIGHPGLRFVPSEGPELLVPPDRIRGARRLRGSPVLAVAHGEAEGVRETFFFFARPPDLPEEEPRRLVSPKGLRRAGAIMTLREQNKQLKPELREWVEAVRGLRRA